MKTKADKIISLSCFLFLLTYTLFPFPSAAGIIFRPTNQITFEWDPVTMFPDNTPLPVGTVINYQVFTRPDPNGPPSAVGPPILETRSTVTFTTEGKFDVGVRAQRVIDGTLVAFSEISWSNDPAVVKDGQTFGVIFAVSPARPLNLR